MFIICYGFRHVHTLNITLSYKLRIRRQSTTNLSFTRLFIYLFIYFIQPPRMEKCDNIIIHSHVHVIQDKSIRHSI